MITQTELKQILDYDPETGIFTCCERRVYRHLVGKEPGRFNSRGYRQIKLKGKVYYAHRLAFLYMTGSVPEVVDHIDGNKSNNRFTNLRPCRLAQNSANAKLRWNNTTGLTGVNRAGNGKWRVNIGVNNKQLHIGTFDSLSDAIAARQRAEDLYHKEYAARYGAQATST